MDTQQQESTDLKNPMIFYLPLTFVPSIFYKSSQTLQKLRFANDWNKWAIFYLKAVYVPVYTILSILRICDTSLLSKILLNLELLFWLLLLLQKLLFADKICKEQINNIWMYCLNFLSSFVNHLLIWLDLKL